MSTPVQRQEVCCRSGLVLDPTAHAVSLQVNSETDFVARNEQFISMVGRVAAAALKVPPPTRQGRVSMTHECMTPSSRSQAAAHGK